MYGSSVQYPWRKKAIVGGSNGRNGEIPLLFGMAGRVVEGQSRSGSVPAGQKLIDLLPLIT